MHLTGITSISGNLDSLEDRIPCIHLKYHHPECKNSPVMLDIHQYEENKNCDEDVRCMIRDILTNDELYNEIDY